MNGYLKDFPTLNKPVETPAKTIPQIRPERFEIHFPVSYHGEKIWLPVKEGSQKSTEFVAVMEDFTALDQWEIEDSFPMVAEMPGREPDYHWTEPCQRKIEIIRRKLKGWNVGDEKFEFESHGWLTDECLDRVLSYPGPLLDKMIDKFEERNEISEQQINDINMQCMILFGTHSGAVENPDRAVALYCTFSGLWEKLGLNMFDLAKLPYKTFTLLRMIMHKEGELREQQMKARANSAQHSRTNLRR